jgi:diguanylate cyclase (GGDEF)-like protein
VGGDVHRFVHRLVVSAALVWSGAAAALDPARLPSQYHSTIFRAPLIPHDSVSVVIEDRQGYLWVGTVEGLGRFDGARSVVYHPDHTPGLRHPFVRDLIEDHAGRIWIGTLGGGLSVFRDGKVHAVPGLAPTVINKIELDANGALYVATQRGVWYSRDGEHFEPLPGTEAIADRPATVLAWAPTGELLIAADQDLYTWTERSFGRLPSGRHRVFTSPRGLVPDRQAIWALGNVAWRYSEGRLTQVAPHPDLDIDRYWAGLRDGDGNLWLGTDGEGLLRVFGDTLQRMRQAQGLANDFVWNLTEDRRGQLWIGTNGGGLQVLRNSPIYHWGVAEGMSDPFVRSVTEGVDGTIYIGTQTRGVYALRGGRLRALNEAQERNFPSVRGLAQTPDGSLWVGGSRGVDRFRDGRYEVHPLPELANVYATSMLVSRDGTLWISALGAGIHAVRDGRSLPLPDVLRELPSPTAAVLEASDGSMWFGSESGLVRWDGREATRYGKAEGMLGDSVTALMEWPAGTIWAGTQQGLARIRAGRVDTLSRANGLVEDRIKTAIIDAEGAIWIGTYRGLQRISLKAVAARLDGTAAELPVETYGLADGLLHLEVNGGNNAVHRDRSGRLYVSTRGGLAVIDPSRLSSERPPVPVRIEAFRADGKRVEGPGPWVLPPDTRRVEFLFTALDPARAPELTFAKRLEGLDPEWIEIGNRRDAEYTSLRAGEYRFSVRLLDPHHTAGVSEASMSFSVRPHWYATFWAYLAYAVLLCGAFWIGISWRVRSMGRQRVKLEQQIKLRTAEVEAANARLAKLSREDALTGVGNRRRFDEALDSEWHRGSRRDSTLGLLLIDVDWFKGYNDTLGHQAGDECLRAIARVLVGLHGQAGDVVARYGGEEFAVLLPDTSPDEALEAAERIRRSITDLSLPHQTAGPEGVVTVSVGVATAQPRVATGPAPLVQAADRALYRAKAEGRNRVVVAI